MKIYKLAVLLVCLCVLFQCIPAANAAEMIEDENVSLTVSYQDKHRPLVGATFHIYRVAAVNPKGELSAVAPFQNFDVSIRGKNDPAWLALIEQLEETVLEQDITPYSEAKTDKDGLAHFPTASGKLEQGLYLVMGDWHVQNERIYVTTPFLVMLPSLDPVEDVWDYDVPVNSKHTSNPVGDLIEYQVKKVWEDAGHETARPKEIKVALLRNGEVWDTVTLSEGSWSYTWLELDADAVWSVKEHYVKDYLPSARQEGNIFYLKNTYTPRLPQTGQLNWPVPVLAVAGLLLVVLGVGIYRRGRKEQR